MTLRANSEAAFQQQVEQLATLYGWRHYHAPDNRPSGRTGCVQRIAPGFPDLILVRDDELIAAELKTGTGRLRPEQVEWLAALENVPGIETFVWRPDDFDDINRRLSRGRYQLQAA